MTDPSFGAGSVALHPSLGASGAGLLAAGDEHPLGCEAFERLPGRADVEAAIECYLAWADAEPLELRDRGKRDSATGGACRVLASTWGGMCSSSAQSATATAIRKNARRITKARLADPSPRRTATAIRWARRRPRHPSLAEDAQDGAGMTGSCRVTHVASWTRS
jgi:hypothetical protein